MEGSPKMPVRSWRRSGRASSSEMRGSGARSAGSDGVAEQVDGAPTSDAMQLSPEEQSVKSRGVVDDVSPEGERARASPWVGERVPELGGPRRR
jgi:hypothetical protein